MARSRLRGRSRAWLVTLGVMLLAGGAVAGSAAAPTWLALRVLSLPGENAGMPAVALDSVGNTVAVWVACTLATCRVQVSERPAGGGWRPVADLSEQASYVEQADVAVTPAGAAVAAWAELTAKGMTIHAAERAAGGVWETPRVLSSPKDQIGSVAVAIDRRGNAVAVWEDRMFDSGTVRAVVRPARGEWSAPVALTPERVNAGAARVAFDAGGNATAVWIQDVGTVGGVVYAARRPARGTWPKNGRRLSSPTESATGLDLAVAPSGTAVVAWSAYNRGIHVARRSAGGTWIPARLLEGGGTNPAVAVDPAGDAVVVWEEGYASVEAAMRPRSGDWRPTVTVSRAGADPDVTLDGAGNAVAVWVRFDSHHRQIEQASRRPAGGSWGRPKTITVPGGPESYGGSIVADRRGNALASIAGYLGHGIAEIVPLDGSGPVLAKLSVPARAKRRSPVRFSVAPFDEWSSLAGPPRWSFGDGATARGAAVTHRYARAGSYTVRVSAADAVGNRTSRRRLLRIGR